VIFAFCKKSIRRASQLLMRSMIQGATAIEGVKNVLPYEK
jgi:hypothetical protein